MEFLWEKIEGNLRWANTKPSMRFRKANTEPFMHLGGPIRKPPRDFPWSSPASPWKTPSFPPLLNGLEQGYTICKKSWKNMTVKCYPCLEAINSKIQTPFDQISEFPTKIYLLLGILQKLCFHILTVLPVAVL